MATRCDECRKQVRGEGHRTVVRVLCDQCYAQFTGAAAGLMAGGSVGDAMGTAGLFGPVRAKRKKA